MIEEARTSSPAASTRAPRSTAPANGKRWGPSFAPCPGSCAPSADLRPLHRRDGGALGRDGLGASRDPFDRMIAAKALELACAVIPEEAASDGLDGMAGWIGRLWDSAPGG